MSSDTTAAQDLNKFFAGKDIAKNYESAERATGPPAEAMIRQAGILSGLDNEDAELEVLDNACGTGVVVVALHKALAGKDGRLKLVCGDFSPQMVESVKERIAQMEGIDAEARVLDGQAMDMIAADHFDYVFTNFGFQSFPEPLKGLRECVRVAKPGGTIGMTNWVKAGWLPAFRVAISRIPGAPTSLPDPLPFMTRTGRLFEASWTRQQLQEIPDVDAATIQIEEHSFTMELKDREEIRAFMQPLEGLFDVFTWQWSEDERKACGEGRLVEAVVQALIEEPTLVWESLITTFRKTTS
ncbi:hypothetical protein D9615_005827 [Tricholomella constricta]|uniref:Methyltransferase domain-containing protein n=1 Tax=Tricholomella constricta TaxID=117010 RepID=A0A8H5M3Z6_9AGAR|nr:hypothetical protein D9615_005827 [Tricholomella constricta]